MHKAGYINIHKINICQYEKKKFTSKEKSVSGEKKDFPKYKERKIKHPKMTHISRMSSTYLQ